MIEVTLPWPPSKLSPNARVHWRELAKQKKAFREACYWLSHPLKGMAPDGPLNLELEFYPPNRRTRDRDNLLASMKSGLDGFADALGIDDSRFDFIGVRLSKDIGGMVKVRVIPA